MKTIDVIAAVLLVIGGLNWGFVGAFRLDLVGAMFGGSNIVTQSIYLLVGAAALYQALQWKAIQRRWTPPMTLSAAR